MSQPSMVKAAKIRDVAARHAYVFDNGLCSPDFFDLPKRMASEEFGLLRDRIGADKNVLEIGCLTGLNLLGLHKSGHRAFLAGMDFVCGAVEWMISQNTEIFGACGNFPFDPIPENSWDVVISFDTLEHQRNVGVFLKGVSDALVTQGVAMFLVPIGTEYNDCGHVAWFPEVGCLRNVLDYVFDVEEIFELKTCRKMFASCRKRLQ